MAPGKLMREFIDSIKDETLDAKGGIQSGNTITEENFHFDNQGLATAKEDKPQMYNLQVQVNSKPRKTSLRGLARETVAQAEVPVDSTLTAANFKEMLKKDLEERGF